MGLTATGDGSGPNISIGTVTPVFDGDLNNWCNYTKYVAGGYVDNSLPGCEYYKDKIPHPSGGTNPDLLENMSVSVDDISGISAVTIEIGGCTATYNLPTAIGGAVADGTSPSGANPNYKNITFNYGTVSTSGGGLPSLRSKFGPRLDACLREGKNYIKVTASDQARSNGDGISYTPNTSTIQTAYLKIDNTVPKMGLSGDAAKIAFSNQPASAFVGGNVTVNDQWKNYTISGGLRTTDPFGNDGPDITSTVSTYTGVVMTCVTSPTKGAFPSAAGIVWTSPFGVNPTTGKFTGYIYDGLGPIPDLNSCNWDCGTGLVYDSASNKCVNSSSLFVLFDSGTPEANGMVAAKLTDDPANSRGLLKFKTGSSCLPPMYMTGTFQSYNFKYQALATYNFATAPTGPFQVIENGLTSCPLAPPPPPVYTYAWMVGNYGACGGVCGTNGIRTRTVKCQRSDGQYTSDSRCITAKPITSEACPMAPCQTQYRARWCHLSSENGTTIGYGLNNPGGLQNGMPQICGYVTSTGSIVNYPTGSKMQTPDGNWSRCDTAQSPEVDINQPLPDSYCPPTPYCTAGGVVPCIVPTVVAPQVSQCGAPQNLASPMLTLNCSDTSLASQWYKSTGRCGEQAGIDYWNTGIANYGEAVTKPSFDNEVIANCQLLADTTNIAQCYDRMLCGYGDYNENTSTCTRNDC